MAIEGQVHIGQVVYFACAHPPCSGTVECHYPRMSAVKTVGTDGILLSENFHQSKAPVFQPDELFHDWKSCWERCSDDSDE